MKNYKSSGVLLERHSLNTYLYSDKYLELTAKENKTYVSAISSKRPAVFGINE